MTSSTFTATDGFAYERQMGRWSQRLAEPLLDFSGAIGDGERVLDLGCGTGSLTLAAAARSPGCRITGVDVSPAYIEHARRRTTDPRIAFVVGDACAIAFADSTFDRVLSLLMLHFVPRASDAILEMRRVAKPGAVVAAAVWDARGGMVAQRMFLDTAAALDPAADQLRAKSCVRPMTRPGELKAAFVAAGFAEVDEAVLTIRMDFAGFEDFWMPHLGRQGPVAGYVASLEPRALVLLREQLNRAYLDGEADGPRSYAASAWAARGRSPG